MVILRPFPPAVGNPPLPRTYRWEARVPGGAIQILDDKLETATLRSGDIIVISSEGVAQAYEFEVGKPVYGSQTPLGSRPPQLADYVNAS